MVRRSCLVILLISLLMGSLGCQSGGIDPSGTWTCTQGSNDYDQGNILELKSDKTLYANNPGENGVSGKWKIEGNSIYLIFEFMGLTWKGEIKGDTVTLEDGSVWVKGKASSSTPIKSPTTTASSTQSKPSITSSSISTSTIASGTPIKLYAYDFAQRLFDKKISGLQRQALWDQYNGKLVEWISIFSEASESGTKDISATFKVKSHEMGIASYEWRIGVTFSERQKSDILKLNIGDPVIFRGILQRYSFDDVFGGGVIQLENGQYVSPAFDPVWTWSDSKLGTGDYLFVDSGQIIFNTREPGDVICALNSSSGQLLWSQKDAHGRYGEKCSPLGADDQYLYFMADTSSFGGKHTIYIFALNRETGAITWQKNFEYDKKEAKPDFMKFAIDQLNVLGIKLTFLVDDFNVLGTSDLNLTFVSSQGIQNNIRLKNYFGSGFEVINGTTNEIIWVQKPAIKCAVSEIDILYTTSADYGIKVQAYKVNGLPW